MNRILNKGSAGVKEDGEISHRRSGKNWSRDRNPAPFSKSNIL
jgi:hypothetical protein